MLNRNFGTSIQLRENYSPTRLTGPFDIGTGNFDETNYSYYTDGHDSNAGFEPKQFNEVVEQGGGSIYIQQTKMVTLEQVNNSS